MRDNEKWKDEEITFLKENVNFSINKITQELNRSYSSIIKKRYELGFVNKKRKWTVTEEEFLKDNWNTLSDNELAKYLNRTISSTKQHRVKFGLNRINVAPWSEEDIEFLKNNFHLMKNKELSRRFCRSIQTIQKKGKELGLGKKIENWSKEDILILEKMKSKNAEEISLVVDRSIAAIRSKLRNLGLVKFEHWKQEDIDFVDQNSHLPDVVVAKKLKRTEKAIQHKRTQLGHIRELQIRRKVNEKFFKEWNPEMAYVTGFIYGDGCITWRRNRYRINFSCKDKSLLEKINKIIESNYPIYLKKNSSVWTIDINRKNMVQDLMNIGLTPRKSLTMTFPKIPDRYLFHFIRGYFDADGHVRIYEGGNLYIVFVSASELFLIGLADRLKQYNIPTSLYYQENEWSGTYKLYIKKKGRRKFAKKMYRVSSIYLERKRAVFIKFYNKVIKINCVGCNKVMNRRGSNHKWCKECASEKKLEWARETYWRAKNKMKKNKTILNS